MRYHQNKRVIVSHIGSTHTEVELKDLLLIADGWIKNYSSQLSAIISTENVKQLLLNKINYIVG